MAVLNLAYGNRANVEPAIASGKIPKGTLITTKDSCELFFYDLNGKLNEIAKKNIFNSMEEANEWIRKYDCCGQVVSVTDGDTWGAYVVGNNDSLEIVAGEPVVKTAPTHEDFPEVGISNVIYMATEENDGKGYIYRWCEEDKCYQRPDDDLNDVSEIYGGSAEDV